MRNFRANSTDVSAGWLANAEPRFVKEPSGLEVMRRQFEDQELVAIAVDEDILQSYQASKRFSVVFPAGLLGEVDRFTKEKGLK